MKRWTRDAQLKQQIEEGWAPDDVVGGLKGIASHTTTAIVCYRYGEAKNETANLNRFAAGNMGFARMCDEIKIYRTTVELQLYQDGMKGSFLGLSGNGSQKRWLIRRLKSELDKNGKWISSSGSS